jgi:hypothetical protein
MRLDAGIDYVFLDTGADREKALVLLFRAKAYHVLDAGLRWRSKDNERERVPHSLEANARAPSYGFRLRGGPEVLRYEDVSTPALGTGELLIKMLHPSILKTGDFISPSSGLVQRKPIPSSNRIRDICVGRISTE